VFCRVKVGSVLFESQQFFLEFLCTGRAWFVSVSRRRSLMRDATEEEGQPTLGVTECNRGLCVLSFGFILLLRLAARCRGGSRRRRRSRKVWDLACIRFGYKKPQSLSAYCRKLRGSASDRSFAFGSARPSFLLSQVSSSLAPYASA